MTNIQYLTLLFPSRLEVKLILWMLGPLALIQAGFSFSDLAPLDNVKVRDLGDSIGNICQSSLGLLYTTALFIWGVCVNWRRAWRTDGGTAWFGALSLLIASSYTVMSFLYIAFNRTWWFNWVCWSLVVWQSWVGFWWWVSAGMGIGEVEDRQRSEDRRRARARQQERRMARLQGSANAELPSFTDTIRKLRRRISGASDDGAVPAEHAEDGDIPLQPLAESQQETYSGSEVLTTTSSDAPLNVRIGRFLERHQPRVVQARIERLRNAHNAAIRRAAVRQAKSYGAIIQTLTQHGTMGASRRGTDSDRARQPRVRLASVRRQDRTEY